MSRTLFLASFEAEEDVLAATREAREKGYRIADVYTPYPVHGMEEAMGSGPSPIGWACFIFGALGCAGAVAFQAWVSTTSWPLDIGGKPFFFWQAFVPVSFELTVLLAGLGTVATFFVWQGLLPWKRPVAPARATDDRFVLAIVRSDAAFDPDEIAAICGRHHAVETRNHLEGS